MKVSTVSFICTFSVLAEASIVMKRDGIVRRVSNPSVGAVVSNSSVQLTNQNSTLTTLASCSIDSPSWALTQDNWVDANVDSNLYAWWHGTSDTVPPGVPPPPVTTNDPAKGAFGLAQQLVSQAAGIQTFQCQIGADLNCIAPQSDFCQYRRSRVPNANATF